MQKKILIIYTGGTIGMKRGNYGYVPKAGYLNQLLKGLPDLKSPELPGYDIVEFNPLYDSSDIGAPDWNKIAATIKLYYEEYHGFIVLHGTDTMAYTASALSFLIEGLDKNIIFTGSQIPLCEIRNDGRTNIITSLMLCAQYDINEVCIYFNGVLLRGNRAYKSKVSGFDAFYSPNFPPIGSIGSKFDFHTGAGHADFKLKLKEEKTEEAPNVTFRKITVAPEDVILLKMYPGLSEEFLKQTAKLQPKGLIIEAFGAGNVPSSKIENHFIKIVIYQLVQKGCLVAVCSQCQKGSIYLGDYATSIKSAGAVSAGDMTTEACLAKMYYILSLDIPFEKKKELFSTRLRGEMSE